jgi:hypothetical protein
MNVALHWWQVTYYDGAAEVYRKVTSDECPDSWAIPDMPIIIAIQIGYEAPEILVNGAQWYFDKRYGWMEMENDFVSLATKLRVEVRHYECYRPGWWEPRKRLWKERWEEAREDLAAKKAELGID